MRKTMLVLVLVGLCAALGAVTALGAAKTVKWHDPTSSTVKISKGGSVKWVWTDGLPHSVHGPGFKSGESSAKGHSYTHKFSKKGTFKIVCGVHGSAMKTTVKVG